MMVEERKYGGGLVMSFQLPEYRHPDFSLPQFVNAPEVKW